MVRTGEPRQGRLQAAGSTTPAAVNGHLRGPGSVPNSGSSRGYPSRELCSLTGLVSGGESAPDGFRELLCRRQEVACRIQFEDMTGLKLEVSVPSDESDDEVRR